MKINKFLLISLSLVFTLAFSSCKDSDNSSKLTTESTTKVTTESTTSSSTVTTTSIPEALTTTKATTTSEKVTTVTTTTNTTTTSVATTSKPKSETTTIKPTSTTKITTTTKPIEKDPLEKAKFKIKPIKSNYTSSATAFACIEQILKYYGYSSANQDDMVKYLEIDSEFYEEDGELFGPNPKEYFVGDPTNTIYGSGEIPIYEAFEKYKKENNININCVPCANCSFNFLLSEYNNNNLAVVWLVNKAENLRYYDKNSVYGGITGILWPKDIRCVLLIGMTDNSLIFSDPTTKKVIEMSKEDYRENYEFIGCLILSDKSLEHLGY